MFTQSGLIFTPCMLASMLTHKLRRYCYNCLVKISKVAQQYTLSQDVLVSFTAYFLNYVSYQGVFWKSEFHMPSSHRLPMLQLHVVACKQVTQIAVLLGQVDPLKNAAHARALLICHISTQNCAK